jgi:HEPN domain-containing protein
MQQHPLDLATSWLEQAKRDLDSARYLFAGERFDATCFACQQAAEKALEAALVWLAGDRSRTHEITSLVAEIASRRDDAASALGDVAALDPYYVTTRYPDAVGGGVPGTKFFAPEARLALERAERAVAFAARLLAEANQEPSGYET